MRDRLLECRAAQGLVASLAPPFDGGINRAGLREMMRQYFGLSCRLSFSAKSSRKVSAMRR